MKAIYRSNTQIQPMKINFNNFQIKTVFEDIDISIIYIKLLKISPEHKKKFAR